MTWTMFPPEGIDTARFMRSSFGWVIGTISGIIGIGLRVPLAGSVSLPTLKRWEVSWDQIGSVKNLRIDTAVAHVCVNTVEFVSS